MAVAEHWRVPPWELLDVPAVWVDWTLGWIEARNTVRRHAEFEGQMEQATQQALRRQQGR